jgi:hypothetical protein
MPELKREELVRCLSSLLGEKATILDVFVLGQSTEGKSLKGYGYGLQSASITSWPITSAALPCFPRSAQDLLATSTCPIVPRSCSGNIGPSTAFHAMCARWMWVGFDRTEASCPLAMRKKRLLTEYVEGEEYSLDLASTPESGKVSSRWLSPVPPTLQCPPRG